MEIADKSTLYDLNIPLNAAGRINYRERLYLQDILNLEIVACSDCGKIPETRLHQYSDGARYISVKCACKTASERISKNRKNRDEKLKKALVGWHSS